MTVSSF